MAPVEKSGKPSETEIKAIKGFNLDWTCRGFQYEIGKTYTHDGPVVRCAVGGFHAVEGYPLEIFDYYPPGTSRYADVSLGGEIARDDSDSKVAAARITVHVEIQISEIIARAVKWVFERAISSGEAHTDEPHQAASSTGDRGAASSTGDRGAASSTGYRGAASSTGDRGAASSTGNRGAASSTGDWGAASSTGNRGAASSTGDRGAASSTGDWGAAMASGYAGRVMGKIGNALFLVERNGSYEIIAVWAGIVGRDGIKPDVFYTLKDGKPVTAE